VEDIEALYRQHVRAVFSYAYSLVRDRQRAEDLTQEAFAELIAKRQLVDASRLPAWLLTVVLNRVRDEWRRARVEERVLAHLTSAVDTAPSTPEALLLACKGLKPFHRTCLAMRYFQGCSIKEIAAVTQRGELQVKSALQYGLQKLRACYRELSL
jgi:RNA polymerase sigma-70 factor (ECF subfamily)